MLSLLLYLIGILAYARARACVRACVYVCVCVCVCVNVTALLTFCLCRVRIVLFDCTTLDCVLVEYAHACKPTTCSRRESRFGEHA